MNLTRRRYRMREGTTTAAASVLIGATALAVAIWLLVSGCRSPNTGRADYPRVGTNTFVVPHY